MKEKNVKNIIGVVLVLLVVAICAATYVYLKTDMFKTPQQLFKKYLADNVNQLQEVNLNPLDEILNRIANEPVETNFDIDLETAGQTLTINVNSKSDEKSKKQHVASKVTDGENEYFNLELLLSNNTLGIQIDELHDKYLALENRDLKKLAKTFELDEEAIAEIPDKLEFLESSYSDEDIQKAKNLKDKYLEKINSRISEDRYKQEKNVQVQVNGTTIEANKYTLTLNNKEIAQIEKDIITELFEDSDFISLYEKTATKEQLEELKQDLIITDEEINNMEDKEVNFTVYESNSKTVKTEITSSEDKIEFCINNVNNESTIVLDMYNSRNDEDEVGKRTTFVLNNKFENNVGTLTLEVNNSYDEDKYEDENYKIVLITEKQDNNKMITKIETDNINELFENDTVKIDKFEISYNFNSDIKIDDFSEENSLILNDYSQEDFQKLLQEVLQNAYNSSAKNPNSLIGMYAQYFMLMGSEPFGEEINSIPNSNY